MSAPELTPEERLLTDVFGIHEDAGDEAAKLIAEAIDHVEHIAQGVPGMMGERLRRGENDDPRTSLVVRLRKLAEAQQQRIREFVAGVTHWVEFPTAVWNLERSDG